MANSVLDEGVARQWHDWIDKKAAMYASVAAKKKYEVNPAAVVNDLRILGQRIRNLEAAIRDRDAYIAFLELEIENQDS